MSDFTKRASDLSSAEKRALLERTLHKQARASRAFPLSYAQERLWFLDQWEPQSAARNIFSILQLQGSLQVKALECSLTEIMRRHEALRTMFLTIEGQPAQVVVPGLQIFMPVVDLRGIAAEAQAEQVQRLAQQEELRPFDLRRAPLLRTILLRLDAAEHIFLLTMHHIISDGWSVSIFNRELIVLYEAFSQGQPSPLPELPIQYTDYARWQREQLQGEVLQHHLAYWRRQLQGAPPFLALPTDRPRPAVQTFAGATHYLVVLADQYTALRAFSQREGVTPFTTLLAVFQVLLACYSQQEDISVGTYIAGRTNVQTEQLIGFFINNLVLRTDLSGDPPFRTLLQRVSQIAQEAYEHQDVPFERLIQELQLERNPSYTPLFQVMLIYQNMPEHELTLPGMTIRPLNVEKMRSNFDLSLWVTEASEKRLVISFEYNPDLFNAMTIERMAGHFQLLLHTILQASDQLLSALSLLSNADLQTLQKLNASEADLADKNGLESLFETQVARMPDGIAAVFEEQQLTYAELDRRAEQLAKALQSRGVGPEVPVGLCLERSLEMVVALLGVLKAGGAYVPLDPSYPAERLTFMRQQAHLLLLLTQSTLAQRLSLLQVPLLCIDTDWPAIALARQSLLHFSHRASHLAYIIYTSGSTGAPKGVAIEQRSLVNFTQAAAHIFEIKPGDRVLQFASLSFDASAEEIYPCLTHGGTLVLRTETMIASPMHFMQACQRWGVTTLDLPTAYWHELALTLEREKLVLSSYLRLVIIGGEHALAERLADWQRNGGAQIKLVNTYGPTETSVAASAHLIRAGEAVEPGEASIIGQAITNVQVYVLDRYSRRLPIGIPGELFVGGQGVGRGYLHHPELTAERFVPDPFSNRPGARLYRTGDLVRLLPDGMLEYRGRVDRQVKLRGFRIELGEIEAALAQHPGVREAAVLLREDAPGEKSLVAYVVSEPAQRATSSDVRNFLQQRLPAYMLPASFVQLESMPLTPNGKLDRQALPVPDRLPQERERIWELPQTPTEELLADIWKQVLHREQVGRHDHFFASGGHSLLATRLVARVREIFEIELPLRTIFEAPILTALAKEIEIALTDQQSLQMPPLRPQALQEGIPLSYAQQRLWFLNQLQPDSPSYNIPLAIRFTGKLDIAAMQGSLAAIMQRQEILRTTFVAQEGRPRQVIAPQPALWLPMVDLSGLTEQKQLPVLALIAQQEAQRPFHLAQGPLLRTTLIRQTHNVQVLLLTMHHIITDAWSIGVFFRELTELYRAWVAERPSSLAELPLQYADYTLWQRQWLEGPVQEQQLAYWRTQLAGAPPLLDLPTDYPRPQEQSYRGARTVFAVPADLVARLRQLGQQEGATLFMVLLAALGGVLARYSGQEDLVVGTPIANRRHTQLEGMIGFFVNTLALRLSLAGRPTVREMLRRVREVALGAYAHQDLPFERVVEALHPQRHLSHTPLFQVVFAWQNVAAAALELPAVEVDLLAMESGIARFDLTLTMQERAAEVVGVLEYRRDLFEPGTIERLVRHLCMQLEGMVATPEQPLATLPLLTPAEQEQVLMDWNETRTPYPQEQGLAALFEAQVKQAPEAIALVFEEQQVSYGELDRRANHLAHALHRWGVRTETLVGLCLERSIEMVIAILAILKAGGAYVPLDLSYPPERLAFMLQDAHIPVLLTQKRWLARFSTARVNAICLDEKWPAIVQQSQYSSQLEARPDRLAYVIYTSGSTGAPKGVQVQQGSVVRLVCGVDYVPLDASVRVLHLAPISFDAATFELWAPLLHGGRCVLFAGDLPSIEALNAVLHREQVTTLWLTASLFNVVIDEAPQALAGLQQLLIGGEALSVPHVRRGLELLPRVQIINGYGPTENTTFSCCEPITFPVPADIRSIPIGRPIANTQAYVLDALRQPVPVGVVGELYLGGAGLARGYLQRPELTAERFVPHPWAGELGERLYRTGDLVRWLPDGRLEFMGRRDGQVKLRGFRIELGEIEAALMSHEAVQEAVVVVQEEAGGEKRLVGYLVGHAAGQDLSVAAVRSYLAERLPDYMLPAVLVPLEELPLTPNGKLDRHALPVPESSRDKHHEDDLRLLTSTEAQLAAIWASVLKLERVGVHDNFFELGGDSILSIQIVAKAHATGLSLTPRHLFQHQTIAQLAAVVGSATQKPGESEVVAGAMPLMPIHHWFFAQALPQPQHWNLATMLQARQVLDPALLAQALEAVLKQHDGLRLRAHQQSAGWQLSFAAADAPLPLVQVDLSGLPAAQQQASIEAAATALQASLNLMEGPLLRVALFDLGAGEPVRLLMAIHHLVVDIISRSILLADLQTAYQQLQHGQAVQLSAKTTSWQQWARRLHDYAQTAAVRAQFAYWQGQAWEQVRPLPMDQPAEQEANREETARALVVTLSVAQTQALLSEVPRAYHTQINDVLLTALVQAFARWTGQSCLLVHLEGHGREDLFEDVDLSRTVGWFTSLIPLVLKLKEGEGPGERLKSIKEQLRAVPQGGISFGLLRYLCQDAAIREHLAALPQPQVAFNYAGRVGSALTPEGLFAPAAESAGVLHSLKGRRPHVLEINGGILDGQLYVQWSYSETLHRHATIEKLAQGYLEALQELIEHCQSPQAGGFTPSDFPQARLSQSALDALLAVLRETGDETRAGSARIEAIYPLSPLQEGMLFHRLYAPESEVYFEQVGYGVRGSLDGKAWRGAWEQVVQQHAILRTLFVWEHLERPLQVVRSQVRVPSEEHDWRACSPEEQAERLEQWKRADRARGFVLGQAPLLRMALHHLSDERVHVGWSFHHLLLDGWSVASVVGEVFACYQAIKQGSRLALPARRSYGDYLIWLQQQDLTQAEGYWRARLRGFSAPTPLGVDRPGYPQQESSDNYHNYSLLLSATTTAGLQRLAREQQVTLNTLVQGAWALLLARYSGQDDVVFGATVSGRPAGLAGVEEMVGLFINTLPVRVQVCAEQRLIPWLQQLQEQQAEARQYEYSPLTQVQGWSEVPRGQPLFESLLVFENYPISASTAQAQQGQLIIENVEVVEQTNYPLTVTVVPDTRMSIRLGYIERRFAAAVIERLAGHLQTVLENMIAQPEQCLSQISLLTKAELQQIVYDWNSTQTDYPVRQSIAQIFEDQAQRAPEVIALVFQEQHLTYRELDERANQLAHYLTQRGVGCETLVGVGLPRGLEMVVALLGILKAGGAYVPLDLSYPSERLAFMQQDAGLAIVLTHESSQERFSTTGTIVVCLERDWPAIARQSRQAPHCPGGSEHLAYVIYTSGSTGVPKGVQVQQGSVLRLVCGAKYVSLDEVSLDEQVRVLHLAPISFDAATFELWAPLLHGGRCVLFAGELPSIEAIKEVLHREQVTTLWLTASLFNVVIDEAPEALAGLQQLLIGGEALSVPHVRRGLELLPGVQIINGYGPTENTTFSCCEPIEPVLPADIRSIPIGRPIANTQAYVLDAQGQVVPVGVVGELYLGGAGLARGYLQRPELTAERFVPHPWAGELGERLYRTGDLVRWLPDGRLEFMGRRDGQVKLRGFRIELGEIEAVLQEHPSVREAVVVIQEPEQGEKQLVAYIVPAPPPALSLSALRAFLNSRLPTYMLPTAFVPLEALPLTANGKLDRRALPAPDGTRPELGKEYIAPRSEIERTLAQIWSQVLHIQQIGVQDDFFELGGHSLLATQIVSRVRASFQIELPLRSLFLAPTIADFAQVLTTYQSEHGALSASVTEIQDEQDDEAELLMHLDRLSNEEMEALFEIMVTKEEIDG